MGMVTLDLNQSGTLKTNGELRSGKMNMAKKIALLFILLVCCITTLGCNTMRGAGEDIEQGGKAIEKAAGK